MIEYIFAIIALISAVPFGHVLKKASKEELKSGREYFYIIWVASLVLAGISLFADFSKELKSTIIFSLLFVAIVAFISWKK